MQKPDEDSSNTPYIGVTVDIKRNFFSDEQTIVHQVNKKFSPGDITLNITDQILTAHLVKLNPSQFFGFLTDLIFTMGLDKRYSDDILNPFQLLFDKIDAIGSYGIRYRKRLYAGYASERKVTGRKSKENERGSYFYATEHEFPTLNQQVPPEYLNQVICGDSEEVLSHLPENCIDLIITSPPYNFGLDYSSSGDSAHWELYLDKLFRVFSEGIRVLKFGGRFIVNVQPLFSDYIPLHHLVSTFFMNQKMIWKGEILWEKNNYNCKYTSWGSWKSPSSPYLKYTWEFIEIFCKGTLKKVGSPENADITDEEFKSWVVAKWSLGPERRMKQYNHPAMFPEDLVERCLKLFSFKGDIILDPFNGAGTSTIVAARTGRKYLGIDISPDYCNTAHERLAETENRDDFKLKERKKGNMKISNTSSSVYKHRREKPSKQCILETESSQQQSEEYHPASG